ncbi:sugar fermentation stimulation protein A [Tissierella praeacuta DSM 18095]|uniref:Sugar fermentation stimulation protein homolog n=1 Tax=Tissierella praeacuta DSM 18095 TaxID=1123404 RepID=A0A1M4XY84_9FIRM|nr:DNA/RNA nuclease SfsA [Tissierella praeacuta]SHE98306.1 sugar fermentation stimulation protein A [Tissierella praeacuta DSM 18095]SUP03418.1 Sugar fermentation stimulation protein A [Tissierella praeacuta]
MEYKKIIEGIFLKRPNRFIAQVLINEKEETVHVKNTGRCKELLIPGAKVILEDCTHNLNRKTKYSIISVWKENMLVNIDSQIPNAVVYHALKENKIKGFKDLTRLKREVTFGSSRYDIYFESKEQKGFIEVKGATLENNHISMFPDAPTERGTKHVLEMIEAVKQGYKGTIFFLIQMKGPKLFRLNWQMDSKFSEAVKLASENGVEILAYDSIIKNNSIEIGNPVRIDLNSKY